MLESAILFTGGKGFSKFPSFVLHHHPPPVVTYNILHPSCLEYFSQLLTKCSELL